MKKLNFSNFICQKYNMKEEILMKFNKYKKDNGIRDRVQIKKFHRSN